MRGRQTLLFMLRNPVPFIAYFLVCWVLLSASITMSDDPFIYGALPDALEEARNSFENLPWSILNLLTALSIILEEIVNDFSFYYQMCLFVIPLALTFSYREARRLRKGTATERQAWIQWYDRQQVVKAQEGAYETPPLSEHIPGGSYFISAQKTVLFIFRNLTLPVGYFVWWIFVFTLIALPIPFDTSDLVGALPEIVIPAVIFTLILSYQEARSNLKGIAIERHLWTKWYYRQIKAIAQEGSFEGSPPSSENMKAYSYFGEIPETLFFMARNLRPPIIHLTCWISVYALLFLTTHPVENIQEIFELIGTFGKILPWIAIIAFIISYQEAKGNLKGIAKARQVWTQWYQHQQEMIRQGSSFEEPPSENTQADSYFRIAQKTLQFMARNPMSPIVHLSYWFTAFFLPYNEIRYSTPVQILAIFALISSYQEARGTVKGIAKEGEVWTKWYQRQIKAEAQGYTLAEVPPAINVG